MDISEQNKNKKIRVSYRTLGIKAGIGSTRTVQESLKRMDGSLFIRTKNSQSGSYDYEIIIGTKVNINNTYNNCDYSVSLIDDITVTDDVSLIHEPIFTKYKNHDAFARGNSDSAKLLHSYGKPLGKTALMVMVALHKHGALSRKQLCDVSGHGEQSIKNATIRLEKTGLVEVTGKPKIYSLRENAFDILDRLSESMVTNSIGLERETSDIP